MTNATGQLPKSSGLTADVVLVGGGLQSGLIVLALRHTRPETSVIVLEREARLGGNHTWCFHDGDVAGEALVWLAPLVEHAWPGYEVRFPEFGRSVDIGYRAITSERFDRVVRAAVGQGPGKLLTGVEVASVAPGLVRLADGREVRGRLVVDARGPVDGVPSTGTGWQKFVGLEVRTRRPHGLSRPLLMDARGPQDDGFRFTYVLPFGPDRALVEDTRFGDDPGLDRDEARGAVEAWLVAAGWEVAEVVREEAGVLPMPWSRPAAADDAPGLLRGGMRGGWFHPATGYSLAPSARLAQWLATVSPEEATGPALAAFRADHERRTRFARRMNWALFRLADPDQRIHMLSRFYRRPDGVVRRFYGLELTAGDPWRVLIGAPPRGMRWFPRRRRPTQEVA
jgi:lycopene beta-cyclase